MVISAFNPSPGNQMQEDPCEFEGSLIYIVSSRRANTTQRHSAPLPPKKGKKGKKKTELTAGTGEWLSSSEHMLLFKGSEFSA